jgi:hypothetical protein
MPNNSFYTYNTLFNPYKSQTKLLQVVHNSFIQNSSGSYFVSKPLIFNNRNTNGYGFKPEIVNTLISQNYKTIGFVVIIHDTIIENNKYIKISHMVSCILDINQNKTIYLDIYDSNGQSPYYDMIANYIHSNICNITNYYILNRLSNIPNGTCEIRSQGICGLWSIIYLFNRLYGISRLNSAKRVYTISKAVNGKELLQRAMESLIIMIQSETLRNFPNMQQKHSNNMRNESFKNFINIIKNKKIS